MSLTPTDLSSLLTTVEAAALVSRNERMLRQAITSEHLPAYNNNGRWLVRREDVIAWDQRTHRRPPSQRSRTTGWERAATALADYGSVSADELAALLGLHPGNARKYLAILAKQGRARRLDDGQWVLVDVEGQGAA